MYIKRVLIYFRWVCERKMHLSIRMSVHAPEMGCISVYFCFCLHNKKEKTCLKIKTHKTWPFTGAFDFLLCSLKSFLLLIWQTFYFRFYFRFCSIIKNVWEHCMPINRMAQILFRKIYLLLSWHTIWKHVKTVSKKVATIIFYSNMLQHARHFHLI